MENIERMIMMEKIILLCIVVVVNTACAFLPVARTRAFVGLSTTTSSSSSPRPNVGFFGGVEKKSFVCSSSSSIIQSQQKSDNDGDSNSNGYDSMGLNELQTLLRRAVEREDLDEAEIISDRLYAIIFGEEIPDVEEEKDFYRERMSWQGLGAAPWLVDRLYALNYTFPTSIQIHTMEAVNKILDLPDEVIEMTSLEERVNMKEKDMGVVISGSTGSGKTLSFLIPLLSTLSDSLFARQRIRVGAEEQVGDITGDLLERIAIVTSPVVRSNARRQARASMATAASMATLGKSGKDVKSPLALIVVPTRELGVQTSMLLYELVGGNIKKDPGEIRRRANMFKYKGPKGIRIGCVLDDEEAEQGLKLQTDVAITMPKYLDKLLSEGDIVPSLLRVVVYDEADLALEESKAEDLSTLYEDDREFSRISFLVGASVTESLGNLAVKSSLLPEGKSYIAMATSHAPLLATKDLNGSADGTQQQKKISTASDLVGQQPRVASLKDLNVCVDPGLVHQFVRADEQNGLLVLTRLLRKELKDFDTRVAEEGSDEQRPRVVVFFPDEELAKKSIAPLRDSLWGEHKLCVLLPTIGVSPLEMMEQFKNNDTSVMLATPNSVRGLDFPAVTHVYTLYLPMDDAREYVHLAGRVGRVGQMGSVRGHGGRVISVLKEQEVEKLDDLANELGFSFSEIELEPEMVLSVDEDGEVNLDDVDVEAMRRYLEDNINLLGWDDDDDNDDDKELSSDETKSTTMKNEANINDDIIDIEFEKVEQQAEEDSEEDLQ